MYSYLEKGNQNCHRTRPVHHNHLDDQVDPDQQVVNKELSLLRRIACCVT